MGGQEKNCIGIIAAEANSIEQRQILRGVIDRARELGRRTVVFSNLYNPYEYDMTLDLENDIYRLIFSDSLCGLVLLTESFINHTLREKVRVLLEQRQDIPIVIIGIYLPELDFPNVRFINANDTLDMEELADHLIDVHGFRRIDLLTGMEGNEAAENRVTGFRRAMEKHQIPAENAQVFYGNFWTDSGEAHARRYLSGELELPEAVICANDYMAYGLLDLLMENGVRVPDQLTVVGYEFIHERIFHAPLLTTYERGRIRLGADAVEIVHLLAAGANPRPYSAPRGRLITGSSCPCGAQHAQLCGELDELREKQKYDKWNVLGTLEQKLTLCSNLDELIQVLGERHYWVRSVQNMYLCLCENWYDTTAETPSEYVTCRSVMPWNQHNPPIVCSCFDFDALYLYAPDSAVHYYLPLFFERHFFGYYVLEYHHSDTYDDIFRNWMKSISIGLTFLCMKNDIRYLLQCQNLSEQHDSLTGLYNQRGLETALQARMESDPAPVYAIGLRIGMAHTDISPERQAVQTQLLQQTAEVFRLLHLEQAMCAHTEYHTFICAGFPCESQEQCERLREKIMAVLLHHSAVCRSVGMEAVVTVAMQLPEGATAAGCIRELNAALEEQSGIMALLRAQPYADTLFSVRNRIYQMEICTADSICRQYTFSTGYFRQIYKEMFGISFHQDTIRARVFCAMYLLLTTVQSIAAIAEQCGYEDGNYFLRQFQKLTGLTPGQYRKNG